MALFNTISARHYFRLTAALVTAATGMIGCAAPHAAPAAPMTDAAITQAIAGKWDHTANDSHGPISIDYEFRPDGTMTTVQKTTDGIVTTVQGTYKVVAGKLNQTYTGSSSQLPGTPAMSSPLVGTPTPFTVEFSGSTMIIGGKANGMVFVKAQ